MDKNTNAAYGNVFFDEFEEILGGNVILKFIRGIGHLLGKMLTAVIEKKHRQKSVRVPHGKRERSGKKG